MTTIAFIGLIESSRQENNESVWYAKKLIFFVSNFVRPRPKTPLRYLSNSSKSTQKTSNDPRALVAMSKILLRTQRIFAELDDVVDTFVF